MNSLGRFGISFFLALLLVSASFADDKSDHPKDTTKPEASAADSDTAAKPETHSTSGPPPAGAGTKSLAANSSPRPAAKSSDDTDANQSPAWIPMPALSGNPGMFTLETGDILPKGAFNISVGENKISRMPGDITALETLPSLGVGLTNWLSASIQFNANTHIHVDEPSLLSLAPVNSGNNQYANTIYPSVIPAQGFRPAYVEDFPFASHNGSGVGEFDLEFKIGLLSEHRGNPLSFSIRNDFYIPTETSFANLIANQVQYGKFNYGVGLEASKTLLGSIVTTVNWDYRFTRSSSFTPVAGAPAETLNLSDQMQVGAGLLMFPTKRFQIISEYSALIYVGKGIPNTTFGARDPVDNVSGLRVYAVKQFALDVGYRYNLNLTNHLDRNGFVIKLSAARWPEREKSRVADSLSSTCSVDKTAVLEGSNDAIQASATARDSFGHPLSYSWTASGGVIAGSGPIARWDSTGAAAGTYSLTVHVEDGTGQSSTCSSSVTVQPK
jgi:hypothetical protein